MKYSVQRWYLSNTVDVDRKIEKIVVRDFNPTHLIELLLYFEYPSLLELSDPFHLQSINNDDKYFNNDNQNDSNINSSNNDNNNVKNNNYDNSNKENDDSNNCKNDEVFTRVISKILLMYQSIK